MSDIGPKDTTPEHSGTLPRPSLPKMLKDVSGSEDVLEAQLKQPVIMPRNESGTGAVESSAPSSVPLPAVNPKLAELRGEGMPLMRSENSEFQARNSSSLSQTPSVANLHHLGAASHLPSSSNLQNLATTSNLQGLASTSNLQAMNSSSGATQAQQPGSSLMHTTSSRPTVPGGLEWGEAPVDPPAVQMKKIKKMAKTAKQGFRKVGTELLPKAIADDNYDGQDDLASEFGQMYYPHGFRKIGERVYDAIRRWFTYFENEEALKTRLELKQHGRLGKKFMENMNETISRNIYAAFLHDLYAQKLRKLMNWIALPLIFINTVSSALGAVQLAPMSDIMFLVLTIIQILMGVVAAVLVAVQKFFLFAEKAAIHETVKQAYFECVNAETLLIYDLSVDEATGMVVSSTGLPLKGEEIRNRLDKLFQYEKRLEGTPDEPVPEAVAGKLQPFVGNLQKEGYGGRWNLVNFPPVLGLKSYFLDVPEMSGCCSFVKNGTIRCQLGHNCQPINHELPKDGCTILCCGTPMFWNEGSKGHVHKTSARLTAENLERLANEKAEVQRQKVPKGVRRWAKKAIRKTKAKALGEGVEDELEMQLMEDVETGGPSQLSLFPGLDYDAAHEAYVDQMHSLDELEAELDDLDEEEEERAVVKEHFEEFIHAHYEKWLEEGEAEEEEQGQAVQGGVPPPPPRAPLPHAPSPPPPLDFNNYQPLPNFAPSAPSPRQLASALSPRLQSPAPSPRLQSPLPSPKPLGPAPSPKALPRTPSPLSRTPLLTIHSPRRTFGGAGPVAEALDASPFEIIQIPEPQLLPPEDAQEKEEEDSEESVKPMSDVASDFGLAYYRDPNFRLPGEKVKHAVVRWWRNQPDGNQVAFDSRQAKRKVADKCKAFLKTITEAMSRNLYIAILHDLYAQKLKGKLNWIAMPLIFMNSFSAVIASITLSNLPTNVVNALSLSTTGLNVVAAVLVAMQKFFMFAEKAALHDAIKRARFEAYEELNTLMVELTVDPDTKVIMDTSGLPISNAVITKKLAEMAHIEKKLEGTPDEPVPESVARSLQPYVSKLQNEGYEGRLALFRFPPVIGIKSYFLEVPEKTGTCALVCDGVVTFQCGSSCKPMNHEVTQNGCELQFCGEPCLVYASAVTAEARDAAKAWQQEPARPHVAAPPMSPAGKKGVLSAAPEQHANMERGKAEPLTLHSRASKELTGVRTNQVAPEPAPSLNPAPFSQELSTQVTPKLPLPPH